MAVRPGHWLKHEQLGPKRQQQQCPAVNSPDCCGQQAGQWLWRYHQGEPREWPVSLCHLSGARRLPRLPLTSGVGRLIQETLPRYVCVCVCLHSLWLANIIMSLLQLIISETVFFVDLLVLCWKCMFSTVYYFSWYNIKNSIYLFCIKYTRYLIH